ncbi:hypothetical protein [Halobacillus halophilus]
MYMVDNTARDTGQEVPNYKWFTEAKS